MSDVKAISLRSAKASVKKYVNLYLKIEEDKKKLANYENKIVSYAKQNKYTGDISDVKIYTRGPVVIEGDEKNIKAFLRKLGKAYKEVTPAKTIPEHKVPRVVTPKLKLIHEELEKGNEVLKKLTQLTNIKIKKLDKYYIKHQV